MVSTTCSWSNEDWRIDFQKDCIDFQVSVLEMLESTGAMLGNILGWLVNIVAILEYISDFRCRRVKFASKLVRRGKLANILGWNHHKLVIVESKLVEKIL